MHTIVLGASGATGKHLVSELLKRETKVTAIVRSPERLPESWRSSKNLTIVKASVLELTSNEVEDLVKDCDAVASCLGHNLTLKGIYGAPQNLVTKAVQMFSKAILNGTSSSPKKFVLMNTAGNSNRDLNEPISFGQKLVIGVVRGLLPPHVDNENAADFLRTTIGQDHKKLEWSVVRPDNLKDDETVSQYEAHPSPTRSAIFNAGTTSRINVGHFMANLICDSNLWEGWKGKMPVLYNSETQKA